MEREFDMIKTTFNITFGIALIFLMVSPLIADVPFFTVTGIVTTHDGSVDEDLQVRIGNKSKTDLNVLETQTDSKGKYRVTLSINIIGFVVARWVLLSLLLFLFTYFMFPEKLFLVQRTNPGFIWKIMLFYPLFSALPQEFIFCKFFFSRCAPPLDFCHILGQPDHEK